MCSYIKDSHDLLLKTLLKIFMRDFKKPHKLETFRYLNNFKFSGIICSEIWLKVKLIWNKNLFVKKIYHEKTKRWGTQMSPCKQRLY